MRSTNVRDSHFRLVLSDAAAVEAVTNGKSSLCLSASVSLVKTRFSLDTMVVHALAYRIELPAKFENSSGLSVDQVRGFVLSSINHASLPCRAVNKLMTVSQSFTRVVYAASLSFSVRRGDCRNCPQLYLSCDAAAFCLDFDTR